MIKNGLIDGKVHMKDIKEGTHLREMPVLIVGDKKFWSPATSKDMLATHDDCASCNKEFEKACSNSRRCFECQRKYEASKYLERPFQEWDGSTFVYSDTFDHYFEGSDEIDDFLNDLDEPFDGDLRLIICTPNYAGEVDADWWCDSLPEDSDIPDGLQKALEEFNKKLAELPPLSWSPGKKRTSYKSLNKEEQ